jgi:hypothetical protein
MMMMMKFKAPTKNDLDSFKADKTLIYPSIIRNARVVHSDNTPEEISRLMHRLITDGGVVEVAAPSEFFDANQGQMIAEFGRKATKVHVCIFPNGEHQILGTSDTVNELCMRIKHVTF